MANTTQIKRQYQNPVCKNFRKAMLLAEIARQLTKAAYNPVRSQQLLNRAARFAK